MLGDDRLVEREGVLQLLDGPLALDEPLEDADARGMGEGAEEVAFHGLHGALAYIDITI